MELLIFIKAAPPMNSVKTEPFETYPEDPHLLLQLSARGVQFARNLFASAATLTY
jgi:hypothetical protein